VSLVRLRPVWMTNHPPSVLWHCWLGHQTCKNRRPYNLYCVCADVKPCSINQSTVYIIHTYLLIPQCCGVRRHHCTLPLAPMLRQTC